MISTQTRRASALAAGIALVGATLTSMPAQAAPGDLVLQPTSGSSGSFNVFNYDDFSLDTVFNTVALNSSAIPGRYAVKVGFDSDGDETGLVVSIPGATENDSLDVTRYSADGEEVTAKATYALTGAAKNLVLDFTGGTDAGYIILSDFSDMATNELDTMVLEVVADAAASTDDTGSSATTTRSEHGDKDTKVTVTAWLDLNADFSDVEATYQAGPQAINFYDPDTVSVVSSIERMTASGDGALDTNTTGVQRQDFIMDVAGAKASEVTGRMKFNKPINYAQIDLSQWMIGTSGTVSDITMRDIVERDITGVSPDNFNNSDSNFEILTASNGKPAEVNGELLFRVYSGASNSPSAIEVGEKMQLNFKHNDQDETSTYSSPQFTFVDNTVAETAEAGTVTVAPTEFSTAISSNATNLSSGVSEFTYTLQAETTSNGAAVETANIPVVALVEATSFLPSGEEFTVSGSSTKIDQANEAVYVSGLTNSDGKFSVTVSASEAAKGTDYNIQFFLADGNTSNDGDFVAIDEVTATYADATGSSFEALNSVSSAANPVLEFTLEDAFGEGISVSPKGEQYSVRLTAPDTDDLEMYSQIATDGTVSFTFENWLSAGESELVTADLYTGTSTSPSDDDLVGEQATVTLYAPVASSAINLNNEEITGMTIEYNDFITGKKDKVGPTTQVNSNDVNGTVVDANGSGIPGTPVTLEADGVQFLTGSTYSIGSVDLVTDAAGAFTAEIWVQEKSSTGITLTATAGTLTDTLLIKSDLPQSNATNRGNLVFSVDMPENVVVNTTYAVTATVTDVFGNPVNGATVKFDGFGSAQFNGEASTSRLTNRKGEAVAYLRSLKDIDGLSSIEISVTKVDHDGDGEEDIKNIASPVATDVETTSWDESVWSNLVEAEVNFLASAADIPASGQKVNAGSFKGYVAVYALGYEGSRLSAKIGNDWVIVDSIVNNESANLARVTDFTGAGYDIAVRIYIDRVLIDTINLTTK